MPSRSVSAIIVYVPLSVIAETISEAFQFGVFLISDRILKQTYKHPTAEKKDDEFSHISSISSKPSIASAVIEMGGWTPF